MADPRWWSDCFGWQTRGGMISWVDRPPESDCSGWQTPDVSRLERPCVTEQHVENFPRVSILFLSYRCRAEEEDRLNILWNFTLTPRPESGGRRGRGSRSTTAVKGVRHGPLSSEHGTHKAVNIEHPELDEGNAAHPLSSEYGTHTAVKARFGENGTHKAVMAGFWPRLLR